MNEKQPPTKGTSLKSKGTHQTMNKGMKVYKQVAIGLLVALLMLLATLLYLNIFTGKEALSPYIETLVLVLKVGLVVGPLPLLAYKWATQAISKNTFLTGLGVQCFWAVVFFSYL